LLVIDGDSFAHRSYHALPKTILRRGRRPAGAILGFANLLLRLYREEQPRAELVAWDTLDAPTYLHEKFPAYQSGREFDDAMLKQLDVLPEPIIFGIGNDLQQLGRGVAPFPRDDAELGHVTADGIRKHRALTHQKLSAAMQHQARLLHVPERLTSQYQDRSC
jgi:hypothetical protein